MLLLLFSLLPIILKFTAEITSLNEAREEIEWEFTVNEIFNLIRQYDSINVRSDDKLKFSLVIEYTIEQIGEHEHQALQDITVSGGGVILSPGYQLMSVRMGKYSFDVTDDQLILRHENKKGIVRERAYYVKFR